MDFILLPNLCTAYVLLPDAKENFKTIIFLGKDERLGLN